MSRPMEEDANEADWESGEEKRDWKGESVAYRRLSQRLMSSIDKAIKELDKLDEEDSSEEEGRPMEEDANCGKNEKEELNTGPLTSVKNDTQEADWESGQENRDWKGESVAYRRLSQRLISSIDNAVETLRKMDEEDSSEGEG